MLLAVSAGLVLFSGLPAQTTWMLLGSALVVVAVIVWAVLQARRDRHRYEEELAREAASQARVRQRLDLAREVHDTISHQLGAITMRAALAQRMPEKVDPNETLQLIETISRAATDDLRQLLNTLDEKEAPRAPARSTAGQTILGGTGTGTCTSTGSTVVATSAAPPLNAFIHSMERAGLTVNMRTGLPTGLPTPIDDAAQSFIREALANTLRHAGPVSITIDITATTGSLHVQVTDDGPQVAWHGAPGTGHGLALLQEEIDALGGHLRYGPRAEGGWQTEVELPLAERRCAELPHVEFPLHTPLPSQGTQPLQRTQPSQGTQS